MARMPKGYSEPLILKSLLNAALTVSQIERKTRIKKPTIYLSVNRLRRKGLVKSGREKRNKKWMLTQKGRIVAKNRIEGERIIKRIINSLRKCISLGISIREVERMVLSKR
ncbi:MAG: winged helix-turn-helix domain-containing protein [Halobacteria archaeon]